MMQAILQGGFAMFAIAACSLAAVAVYLAKARTLSQVARADLGFVADVVSALRDRDETRARGACTKTAHPAGEVVEAALDVGLRRPERAPAEAERVARARLVELERHIDGLGLIAQIAPLLGLLGTALGMVDLFSSLEAAGLADIDVSAMSAGIWKALSTTAAGLAVAIPALAGHARLESKANRVRLQLEDSVARVLHELPAGLPA